MLKIASECALFPWLSHGFRMWARIVPALAPLIIYIRAREALRPRELKTITELDIIYIRAREALPSQPLTVIPRSLIIYIRARESL